MADVFLGMFFSVWPYGNPAVAAEPQGPDVPLDSIFFPLSNY